MNKYDAIKLPLVVCPVQKARFSSVPKKCPPYLNSCIFSLN